MDTGKELDRARIEEAFRIMGRYLLERGILGEITIYGGSAILFQFGSCLRRKHRRGAAQDIHGILLGSGASRGGRLRLNELARAIVSRSNA
jgi:hypothetical protein